jgi:NTE family protein
MERLVEDSIGDKNFDDLGIPFAAVSTDLKTGERVVIRGGSVSRAVHASSAVPGVFVPVHIGGRLLSDGLITDNVPVDVVREMGADIVIASDVIPKVIMESEPENMVEVVERSLDIGIKLSSQKIIAGADFVIEPVRKNIRPFALTNADELINMGIDATRSVVPKIRRKLLLPLF